MASELHPWRFELELFSKSVTLWLLAILQWLPKVTYMCTWFSALWRRFQYDRKCLFSCIYNPQITSSPTSLFRVNFNRNCVKNHPQPWTCPFSICQPSVCEGVFVVAPLSWTLWGHQKDAGVHWQMHSKGWEDCVCDCVLVVIYIILPFGQTWHCRRL